MAGEGPACPVKATALQRYSATALQHQALVAEPKGTPLVFTRDSCASQESLPGSMGTLQKPLKNKGWRQTQGLAPDGAMAPDVGARRRHGARPAPDEGRAPDRRRTGLGRVGLGYRTSIESRWQGGARLSHLYREQMAGWG